ncbi:MAG: translocation/assembly module TamB domain-containing protein [Ferruginibacter sp.]
MLFCILPFGPVQSWSIEKLTSFTNISSHIAEIIFYCIDLAVLFLLLWYLKIFRRIFVSLLLLLVLMYGLLHLSPIQTWAVKQISGNLSEKLKTKVSVRSVDLSFFDKLEIKGVMIEDLAKDTLLYAGSAKIKLTDWFFFKDHVTLHYIGLDDAIVNMNRLDSTWNYQFLLDYFSSPSNSKDTTGGVEFDFKEAHFKNIRFNRSDGWIGQGMVASMKQLDVLMDSVNLSKKRIIIKEIKFEGPHFALSDFTGKRPEARDGSIAVKSNAPAPAYQWNDDGWTMQIKKVLLNDGSFMSDQETIRPRYADRFDGQHVFISSINGELSDIAFTNDTLSASVHLSAKERSGFIIKKLTASMKFTPGMMEFKDLDLITNNSHLKNYYAMRYDSFNKDMQDFLHSVNLEGRFTDSELNTDDLAFFAPELSDMKRVFYFNGKAKGTIDNLSARDLKIKTGNTFVDGDIALRGLPDITKTFIDFKGNNLQTNYKDLVTIIPALKNITQPQLSKLGNIYFKGNFTGFINDFVTYGTIVSNLGTANTDINMKIPEYGPALYSGKINTQNFRLGQFMNSTEFGTISLNGKVKGSGFTLKDLNANFDGDIKQIEFNGYNFQNIQVNGDFEKSLFKGHLTIDDPNIKINFLDGSLSLAGKKEIAFNVVADVAYARLKNIHFTKDDFSLKGFFGLNFTGNNIDNFLGTARVFDAQLTHDTTLLSFDSLTLSSFMRDDKKYLSLESNEIDAELNGKFKILELPDAFKLFLNRYYPAYIKKPSYKLSDQDFSFDIKTREVDEYIKLFDKRLRGFNYSSITGRLNLAKSELSVNADVPEFIYDGKSFTNIKLTGNGNGDTLKADISVDAIGISDSLHFPGTKLQLTAHNDVSEIHLKTSADKTLSDAELNATIQTYADGIKVHFSPSSFIINDKKWEIEKDGELTIRKRFLDASEIKFVHNNQQLTISTQLNEENSNTDIIAKMKEIDLEDFTPFAFKDPSLKGKLTGTAIVSDPFGKFGIAFQGEADSLSMNEKYIGKVRLDATANTITGAVKFKVNSDEADNTFAVDGSLNYKDSTDIGLNLDFAGKRVNVNILEPYMNSIFDKMSGFAETNLKIYSRNGEQFITGDAKLTNDTIRVQYTQCPYVIKDQLIHFAENVIDLGHMRIRDTLNNEGTISGKIYHRFFDDLSFENVRLETGKLLLLHTTKKDNADFYGNVIGRAILNIDGPTTNLVMNIDGEPSILDSSHIYLPTGTSKEGNATDYIEFIQFGTEMEEEVKGLKSTNIVVNLNLKANPACKIDVILDEETGDVIKGEGNGNISIRAGNKEPLTIRGKYELTKGEYTFNFQTFFKKPFTLNNGSITWTGDPLLANIDIQAEYLAKDVDISQLTTTGKLVQKQDIIINANLTGSLQKPLVKFEFDLPANSEIRKDYIIVKRLADFQNDENEMNKQVASLLLFNSFIIGDQNFLSGGNTLAAVTSSVGGIISGWLTTLFNKQLEKATKGILSTYIDINPTFDIQKNASQLQASVKAGLKLLLSSRLVLLVGGNLDYNNSTYTQQLEKKGLVTPDISIEWLLNKEGSIRVVGFNRSSVDFTLTQRNRSGVQLSYRKDMNKFWDIFKTRKKIEAEEKKRNSKPKVPA